MVFRTSQGGICDRSLEGTYCWVLWCWLLLVPRVDFLQIFRSPWRVRMAEFHLFFPRKKNPPRENPGSHGFLLKKNMDETTLLDLSAGSSKNFWKDGLIEFQFLPQNVRSRFWGVQKLDFWMGFSMNFLKKCVDNFGSLYYLRNKTWLFRATSRVTGFIHPNDVVDWMVDWWLMEPFLFNLSSRSSSRSNLLVNLYICMLYIIRISKHQFPFSLLQMTFWLTFDWWHLFAKVLLRQPGESLGASKKKCHKFAIRTRKKAGTSLHPQK